MKAHRPFARTVSALGILALAACTTAPARNNLAVARQIGVPPTAVIDALLLADYDANRDRMISRAEFSAGTSQAWAEASKGSAKIGIIALQAWQSTVFGAPDALPRFAFDSAFNGEITQEKFTAGLNSRFALLDANRDGQISRAELFREAIGTPQAQLEPGPPNGGARRPPPQR